MNKKSVLSLAIIALLAVAVAFAAITILGGTKQSSINYQNYTPQSIQTEEVTEDSVEEDVEEVEALELQLEAELEALEAEEL